MKYRFPPYRTVVESREKDSQPVNDIARRLLLETNTVTPLLKRMETEGYVQRVRGKEDARQIIVSLTEKGRELERRAAKVPACLGAAVACGSITPETVPGLFATLDDLIATLADS
jgi:DNA-binding MarR family transcriptional regulator